MAPMASSLTFGRCGARGWVVVLALPWVVWSLLTATPAGAAHPPAGFSPEADSHASAPDPAPMDPVPASLLTAALVCVGVLAVPGVLLARRSPRLAALGVAALLVWSAGETALHSAHHLGDPAEAQRCPASAASHHLPGLDPESGGPVLERPATTATLQPAAPVDAAPIVLDELQARAPPAPAA